MALFPVSYIPLVDANGDPIVNAYLYFGIPDTDPVTNPKDVYDQDGNIIANPVRTGVDGCTTVPVDLNGEYSLIIKDSNGVQLKSIPNGVYGVKSVGGGSSTNYWEAVTDSGSGTTVIRIDKAQSSYAVFDYPDVLIGTNTSNIPLLENKGGGVWALNSVFIIDVDAAVQSPINVNTNYAGATSANIGNSNAGNYDYSFNLSASGTGSVYYNAFNNTGSSDFLGSVGWADDKTFVLNAGGSTAYTVTAFKSHQFSLGASQGFTCTWASGDTLQATNDGTDTYFRSTGATFYLGTNDANSAYVITNGITRYRFNQSGDQFSDGPGQPGTLEPVFHLRVIARNTNGNTTIQQPSSSVTVSCSRPATGQWNYTIAGRSGGSLIYPMAICETAGYTASCIATGTTTFTVNITDSAGVAQNALHTIHVAW